MSVKEEPKEDLYKEIALLNRQLREKEKTIRGYKGLASRNKPEEPPQVQKEPQNIQTEPEKPAQIHTFKPWQAGCAECGEKNADYKPETKCDNCGGMLGTVEVARKLDYCPHCTAKAKFVPLTAEAKAKVEAMMKV